MVSVLFLLVVGLSLDFSKSCKGVNHDFKAYGVKTTVSGCKKGCQGYHNVSGREDDVDSYGRKCDSNWDCTQSECIECKTISAAWVKKAWPSYEGDDEGATERAKDWCGSRQCYWKKGKCVAGSCLVAAARDQCDQSFGHEWADGKCKRVKGDKCKAGGYVGSGDVYDNSGTPQSVGDLFCSDLAKYYKGVSGSNAYTADDVTECKYKCEHPEHSYYAGGPWDYTRYMRKYCHRLMGCMYSINDSCSALAIWAFVVILVVVILVFVAIIVVIVIIILKLCGSKSTKVDPAADKTASTPVAKNAEQAGPAGAPAGAPATQGPPPEVGPYVVIKLGKQESKTKKVESAVWGQSIVFTGLGPEDDDVLFELHDNNDVLLGSADVRIPDYVNAKKRATVTLKNGEAVIGVLEADIEIQVQEEPEVKITGVFFVDKFAKA